MEKEEREAVKKYISSIIDSKKNLNFEASYALKEKEEYLGEENKKIELFIKETKDLKEKNNDISILYKFTEEKHRVYLGFILRFENHYYNIYSNFHFNLKSDKRDDVTVIKFYSLDPSKNTLIKMFNFYEEEVIKNKVSLNKCMTIHFLKRIVGEEIYQEIIDFFLKNENLLVKNSIYNLY